MKSTKMCTSMVLPCMTAMNLCYFEHLSPLGAAPGQWSAAVLWRAVHPQALGPGDGDGCAGWKVVPGRDLRTSSRLAPRHRMFRISIGRCIADGQQLHAADPRPRAKKPRPSLPRLKNISKCTEPFRPRSWKNRSQRRLITSETSRSARAERLSRLYRNAIKRPPRVVAQVIFTFGRTRRPAYDAKLSFAYSVSYGDPRRDCSASPPRALPVETPSARSTPRTRPITSPRSITNGIRTVSQCVFELFGRKIELGVACSPRYQELLGGVTGSHSSVELKRSDVSAHELAISRPALAPAGCVTAAGRNPTKLGQNGSSCVALHLHGPGTNPIRLSALACLSRSSGSTPRASARRNSAARVRYEPVEASPVSSASWENRLRL